MNSDVTWVRLQILEKNLFNVSIGQKVTLEFADGTLKIEGSIDRVDAGLETKSQVGWAWYLFLNPALVPGLVGNAVIQTNSQNDRIAIPLRSVYSDGLQTYVFVEEASTRSSAEYKKRNVMVGSRKLIPKPLQLPLSKSSKEMFTRAIGLSSKAVMNCRVCFFWACSNFLSKTAVDSALRRNCHSPTDWQCYPSFRQRNAAT